MDRRLEPCLPKLARAIASIEVTGAPLKTAPDRAVEAIEAAEKSLLTKWVAPWA